MKLFKKSIYLLTFSAMALTSCIDEVTPTSIATQDMVEKSSSAQTSMLYGIPSAMLTNSRSYHFAFGYSAMMHIRDVMTGDIAKDQGSGYDQFSGWEQNTYMGRDYVRPSYIWTWYYDLINTINNVISSVNPETATSEQLGILGAALTYRALAYTDLAQMYEVKANDILPEVDGKILNGDNKDIKGLTVPIITEKTTEEESHNTPRATRDEIFQFIETDLLNAVEYIPGLKLSEKTFPHLDCTYGMLARLYLWHGDYDKAYDAAMNAIQKSSVKPIVRNNALSLTNGFNQASDFMWAGQFAKENDAVVSGIINWTSHLSNEQTFGYAGPGGAVWLYIDASLYSRISNTDWRKLMWKAPEGSLLAGKTSFIDEELGASMPAYSSVKFRPGQGNVDDHVVAASVAFPVMRVEEMYFIAAEAAARTKGAAEGMAILSDFMKANRDAQYSKQLGSLDEVIEEIILQKRIELWGEGHTFFDIKRLNMPVTRGYEGSNHPAAFQFNTTTFPGWMNLVIPRNEENTNLATKDYSTPDPSDKYTPWNTSATRGKVAPKVLKLK